MQISGDDQAYRSGIVTILGPPNAGKSTLLNCMLGQKVSIVTPKPQTTRNRISGILTLDRAQVVFLDTPGVHQTEQTMNKVLVEAAWQALSGTDLLLLVLDAKRYTDREERLHKDVEPLRNRLDRLEKPFIIVLNKTDLVRDKSRLLPLMDELSRLWPDARLFPLSAVACDDTQALVDHIARLLPPGPPFYPEDQLSTLPMRFMAAEIVREKLFLELEQELPYSLAVVTEHWQEDAELGTVLIHALIYVSRRNHKKMVIGRRGQRLKKVGSLARKELEAMLGTRVRLELWVKIRHGWDEDRNFLLQLQAETGE